jgi:hypothetical protein
MTMTFDDARDPAIEFGAKLPKYDHTSPLAQAWIDRIALLPTRPANELPNWIALANCYA